MALTATVRKVGTSQSLTSTARSRLAKARGFYATRCVPCCPKGPGISSSIGWARSVLA